MDLTDSLVLKVKNAIPENATNTHPKTIQTMEQVLSFLTPPFMAPTNMRSIPKKTAYIVNFLSLFSSNSLIFSALSSSVSSSLASQFWAEAAALGIGLAPEEAWASGSYLRVAPAVTGALATAPTLPIRLASAYIKV